MGIKEPDVIQECAISTVSVGPATSSRKRAGSSISSSRIKLFKPQKPKMMTMSRSVYRLPSRFDIDGRLLEKVQATMMED